MTDKTVTALFDTYVEAATAVSSIEAMGVPHDDIAIVSNDPEHREGLPSLDDHPGTATGASLGTLVGGGAGLLAGLGMLAIPGFGPVIAAGWLASTLVGAGVGAAAGGIVGGLTDAGMSDDDAHAYAEGIHRGGTLVTVRVDEKLGAQVRAALHGETSVDLHARVGAWRDGGWTGFRSADRTIRPDEIRPSATAPVMTGSSHGVGSLRQETVNLEAQPQEQKVPGPTKASDDSSADDAGLLKVRAYDTTI